MTNEALQQKRLIAAAIDIGIGFALGLVLWLGGLLLSMMLGSVLKESVILGYTGKLVSFATALISLAYILGRDVLAQGRSIGKKIQDIHVVTGAGPITFGESLKRNVIFAAGPAIWLLMATIQLVPFVGGLISCIFIPFYFLGSLASIAAVIVEVIKIMQDPQGERFGDQWAKTRVIE